MAAIPRPCRKPRSPLSRGCSSRARRRIGEVAGTFFFNSAAKKRRKRLRGHLQGQETDIHHVHVIGAHPPGRWADDIAAKWCVAQGLTVTLSDLDPLSSSHNHLKEAIAKAIGQRGCDLFEKVASNSGNRAHREMRSIRLVPDFSGAPVMEKADVIIEAVAEKTEIKHKVLEEIANRARKDALIGTNTSSIPRGAGARSCRTPRGLSAHFFNPVNRMELVEVGEHPRCPKPCWRRPFAFCGAISRLPAPVKERGRATSSIPAR